MRIARLFLVLIALLALAQPLLACRECNAVGTCDRNIPPPTNGCMLTMDGCSDGIPCSSLAEAPAIAATWSIASVQVTHGTTPANVVTARPVLASARPVGTVRNR